MNRCLNDIFANCKGEPKGSTREEEWSVAPDSSNKNTGVLTKTVRYCTHKKETCKKFLLNSATGKE